MFTPQTTLLVYSNFVTSKFDTVEFFFTFLGQYLRPTDHHLAVVEYVRPEQFQSLKEKGDAMGFKYIAAGPLVRSSYKAGEFFLEHMIKSQREEQ